MEFEKCTIMCSFHTFDSISITKTHNRILEENLDNHATCQEHFVMLQSMFYKPINKVQIPLYKTNIVWFPLTFETFW